MSQPSCVESRALRESWSPGPPPRSRTSTSLPGTCFNPERPRRLFANAPSRETCLSGAPCPLANSPCGDPVREAPRQLIGSSTYETWRLTLDTWQRDPTTPLDHLPAWDETTFSPQTSSRLLTHVNTALQAVIDRWGQQLSPVLSRPTSAFELGRDLVSLRASLARVFVLAGHPSLPEKARTTMLGEVERVAAEAQRDLENGIRRQLTGSGSGKGTLDAMLGVLRANPVTDASRHRLDDTGRMSMPAIPQVPTSRDSVPAQRQNSRFAHRVVAPHD